MTLYRLGRCERIDDVWIAGEFKLDKVECDEAAKEESIKLAKRAKAFAEKENLQGVVRSTIVSCQTRLLSTSREQRNIA